MEMLKQKDAAKTTLLQEIADLEKQIESGEDQADSLAVKKAELEEVSAQMRELGASLKAAKESEAVAAAPAEEAAPVVSETPEPITVTTETPSPAPEAVSSVAEHIATAQEKETEPAASPVKQAKPSGKVMPRKAKSAPIKKAASKEKSAKTSNSSSTDMSAYTSKFFSSLQMNGMMALQVGMQHRSVLMFGISAAFIYVFGEYASI